MSIAYQFIRTGDRKNILVIGAEVQSKGIDRTTRGRDMAVLFGDGAGAVVMQPTKDPNGPRVYSCHLHADGNFAKELWISAPTQAAENERMTHEMIERGDHYPRMNGKTVFLNASRRMPEAVHEALESSGFKLDDIDVFLFHQANLRINEMVAKQLGIPESKVISTIQKFGNTTAATIPLGMHEAIKTGRLKPGMLVASAAFGSGFTWGSSIFRF